MAFNKTRPDRQNAFVLNSDFRHLSASLHEVRGLAVDRGRHPADPPHAVKVVGHVHGEVVVHDVHRVARVDPPGCLGYDSIFQHSAFIAISPLLLVIT